MMAEKSHRRAPTGFERRPTRTSEDRRDQWPQWVAPVVGGPAGRAQLQRKLGNRAVGRLLGSGPPGGGSRSATVDDRVWADQAGNGSELGGLLSAQQGRGHDIPDDAREDLEASIGAPLKDVRLHTDPTAAALAAQLAARAFTVGQDIYFAQGAYDPVSATGYGLLAHEVTHTLQQPPMGSAAAPSGSLTVDAAPALERQAEQVADRLSASRRLAGTGQMLRLERTAGSRAVAGRVGVQRSPESDLIDEHTSWGNLAEDDLGRALLTLAMQGQHAFVQSTLSELGSQNRDDVSLEFLQAATDEQLMTFAGSDSGRHLLDRMLDELTEGSAAEDEKAQAERILRVKAQRIDPTQAQQQMLTGKVFPFRSSGITVLDDAPIMAERRDRGQIWVKQPTRVLGTSMFRDETATLPVDTFIGGVLLPEDEIIGVKFYDLGGEVVYRPALFLVQVSNQNDTESLATIATVAGIGLTLGSGALVGLGVRASMAARVLLWADRAAFALGTLTTVINEHRGDIIARYGDSGRHFLRYVDVVHSATAMYGFARLAIGMGQVVNGLRTSYVNWKSVVRSVENELDDAERQVVQQISQQTDDVLQNAEQVSSATAAPRRQPPGEPTTIPPERQLGPGKRPTPRERLEAGKAARAEQARLTEIREGIARVDRELAAGTHRRQISKEDLDWLNSNPRYKEIAFDPDVGTYRVSEARQAIAAEQSGVLTGPVSRSTAPGTDLLDGAGGAWSLKGTGPDATVDSTVNLIAGEALVGRPCLADLRGLSMREQAVVRTVVSDRLAGQAHAEIRFLPAGVERIRAR